MIDPPVSIKSLLKIVLLSLLMIIFYLIPNFFNSKTKIVFCDIGQGDGTYIRVKNKIDLLIDAGPDRKILTCLGKHMPIYDRTIELAFLSHPQKDHYGGYLYLLDHYKIKRLFMVNLNNPAFSFQELKRKLAEKKVSLVFPTEGTKISFLNNTIGFIWPTEDFLAQNIYSADNVSALEKKNNIVGISSIDPNYFSLIFNLKENHYKILFTGDAPPTILKRLSEKYRYSLTNPIKTTILKVPHHGSKNGLILQFLKLANPKVGVISVGKNNPYGHPHKEILTMLKALKVKIRRTDKEGDIVFQLTD